MSDWEPSATLDMLRNRARMLHGIRAFFALRGVMEVSPPLLSGAAVTDPQIESIHARVCGETRYLHTSPEFAMKRLLAAGSGDIYYLGPVFRDGERGRRHATEFTMLEWYRLGFDLEALMTEVETLLLTLAYPHRSLQPAMRLSYREAFLRYAGIDPFAADDKALAAVARERGLDVAGEMGRDDWLDLLISTVVAPQFPTDRLTLVFDYPASQAALARVADGPYGAVARRFEAYLGELELVNGFHELAVAEEQRARFEADLARRQARGQAAVPMDDHLLAALAAGLPDCAGVSVGIDRLLMAVCGEADISAVQCFCEARA
ncbi:MAG TPA: EF-P lysine aminoacylase GenX [Thioalkalivibrio sp.]|nr:EF-P lysine aminoacylase GenX [Thioalkalivibrio sp.]